MQDIVERLMRQIETGPDVEDIVFINPDGPDAVDEIERLDAEIERLREALNFFTAVDEDNPSRWKFYRHEAEELARFALQQKDSE